MSKFNIIKLAMIGFLASFLNAGFGIGTSFVLGPALIQMGVFPLIAGQTGKFVSTSNNISSTIA
jgi:uncharacterized membrane protein YfcA